MSLSCSTKIIHFSAECKRPFRRPQNHFVTFPPVFLTFCQNAVMRTTSNERSVLTMPLSHLQHPLRRSPAYAVSSKLRHEPFARQGVPNVRIAVSRQRFLRTFRAVCPRKGAPLLARRRKCAYLCEENFRASPRCYGGGAQ